MFKQVRAPLAHDKERAYPKTEAQGGDDERYSELQFRIGETIFAANEKAEMRKAKILLIASSDFVHASGSLLWPDVITLAGTDLDWMQPTSMAIGVQQQNEMSPITIAGINDHLHSRGFLSRLREPITVEAAVWPATKDILESMCESMDVCKEGGFQKITPKPVFVLFPGHTHLPDGLKLVYCNDSATLRREI